MPYSVVFREKGDASRVQRKGIDCRGYVALRTCHAKGDLYAGDSFALDLHVTKEKAIPGLHHQRVPIIILHGTGLVAWIVGVILVSSLVALSYIAPT